MMDKKLQEFVSAHPEFFLKTGDTFVLKPDLHELVEQYARMVDPDEFERVRQLVRSIQKDHREHLEQDIRASQEEIDRQKEYSKQVLKQLDAYDAEMDEVKNKIAEIRLKMAEYSKDRKPFYYSSTMFWLLAAMGVACIYVGFFITVSGAATFLPIGFAFLLTGVTLQSRQVAVEKPNSVRMGTFNLEIEQLEAKRHLLKVRRATSLQQKIIANQAIEQLEAQIRKYDYKHKMLNG